MFLLFNTLSGFVIALLPRSNCLSSSRLQLLSTVNLEPEKIKSVTVSTFSPSMCHEVMGLDAMFFFFWMLNFEPAISLSFLSRVSLVPLCFLPLEWYHLHVWGCWYSSWQSGSKLVNGPVKMVYCHPASLTYIQGTSCKMPGWMNHKLESGLLGEMWPFPCIYLYICTANIYSLTTSLP